MMSTEIVNEVARLMRARDISQKDQKELKVQKPAIEAPKDEVEAAKKIIKHEMENAIELKVPLKVDVGVGKNWLEAH